MEADQVVLEEADLDQAEAAMSQSPGSLEEGLVPLPAPPEEGLPPAPGPQALQCGCEGALLGRGALGAQGGLLAVLLWGPQEARQGLQEGQGGL